MATGKEPREIIRDKALASLGDAYLNFVYSMALTTASGSPKGAKVEGRVLAEACRRSGLRRLLPRRATRKELADAVEAIAAYAYIIGLVTVDDAIGLIAKNASDPVMAFTEFLEKVLKRLSKS